MATYMPQSGVAPTFDDVGPSSEETAWKRKMAAALLGQATDASSKQHWAQVAAQAFQGLSGGWMAQQARDEDLARKRADRRIMEEFGGIRNEGGELTDNGAISPAEASEIAAAEEAAQQEFENL